MQDRAYTTVRFLETCAGRARPATAARVPHRKSRVAGGRAARKRVRTGRAPGRYRWHRAHALPMRVGPDRVLVNQSCLRLHAETGCSRDTAIEDPQMRAATAAMLATLLMLATATQARLREELMELPVEVADAYGKVLRHFLRAQGLGAAYRRANR